MNQELENPWQSVLASNVQPGRKANDSRGQDMRVNQIDSILIKF